MNTVTLRVRIRECPGLAHLYDASDGEEGGARDLLNAHPFLLPRNVMGDAGDDLPSILRQQVRQ